MAPHKHPKLQCVQTIGKMVTNIDDEFQFRGRVPGFPVDVKLSYNHSCILIADFYNNCVHLLDIDTKAFKLSILIPISPLLRILVEENYISNRDALIVSSNDEMLKYDLGHLIESSIQKRYSDCLWRIYATSEFMGMTLVKEKDRNSIYVCGSPKNSIAKIDSLRGVMDEDDSFTVFDGFQPVINSEDNSMIVGIRNNTTLNLFEIYSQNERGDWCIHDSIPKEEIFSLPQDEDISFSFLLDETNEYIILNKEGHGLLLISLQNGHIVDSFENRQHGANIGGMCFNSKNGELLVCDAQYGVVRIFNCKLEEQLS
ncbi:predicted protein [Naegleria gruberi]|uniref:Predicted protein n=1 Tax=Naegleria gruberi TaxID=5762 RepID=D2V390_NAEGR|nr:uncharacterized protein NAEGRDRAFT_46348 [Naegleria gruberi]EFC48731.1 predicted protein [Naegleria gruberi]|eukprot:XP_002681475.1 predicted protein [Naegleria gruberi strain NEG-M]